MKVQNEENRIADRFIGEDRGFPQGTILFDSEIGNGDDFDFPVIRVKNLTDVEKFDKKVS